MSACTLRAFLNTASPAEPLIPAMPVRSPRRWPVMARIWELCFSNSAPSTLESFHSWNSLSSASIFSFNSTCLRWTMEGIMRVASRDPA